MVLALWAFVVLLLPGQTGIAEGFAQRTVELPASAAWFRVTLGGPAMTAGRAAEMLAGIGLVDGIPLQDFTEFRADHRFSNSGNAGRRQQFLFVTPAGRLKPLVRTLDEFCRRPPEREMEATFTVSLEPSRESIIAAEARLTPELLAEARAQAERSARLDNRVLGELIWTDDTPVIAHPFYSDSAIGRDWRQARYAYLRQPGVKQTFAVAVVYATAP